MKFPLRLTLSVVIEEIQYSNNVASQLKCRGGEEIKKPAVEQGLLEGCQER